MALNEKIPLKQAEVSVRRFNDLAIPHHLSLLKNHRSNIEKSLALGDWNKIKKEEINATRVIKQIKNLLIEMDALRERVRSEDLERFDIMMEDGKSKAFQGMSEYLELKLKAPSYNKYSGLLENYEEEETPPPAEIGLTTAHRQVIPPIETKYEQQEYQLQQRQACLDELEELQNEIRDLNGMYLNMHQLVQEQGNDVRIIADNAEEALENVQIGESNLRKALTYKKAMYPVVGALIGTCVGGPIGLVAGLKAGGLAAVGCGILGFTGGSVLKSNPSINPTVMQGNIEEESSQEPMEMERKDE
ncbi:PREDICTED: syntaxin-17 [Bactrocera latifrons]|uniref:syntaxin-17 n=1 Tax=Bactrocera latifrons TaxID=174628 RepID=UPI0008DE7BCF|nr:PREDICTED: syntaxin-17 [Bactrocera latifrons]